MRDLTKFQSTLSDVHLMPPYLLFKSTFFHSDVFFYITVITDNLLIMPNQGRPSSQKLSTTGKGPAAAALTNKQTNFG